MPVSPAASSTPSRSPQGNAPPDVQHAAVMNKLWPVEQHCSGPKTVRLHKSY
ncbi:hypothetical protein JVT61DRAFT_3691 [Boletus reticuloceps]|uniref:Uncharacterized protein n=1 Tax=Boletus reticuloceps TaxID=495285 RepID=A0A8I2YN57_9AGAM|nr:hypothetical protein JVT61DRAFT_3691 [Boletus reticuloceps]